MYASYEEVAEREPNTYEGAIKSVQLIYWIKVMKEELSSLAWIQTSELVPKNKNKSIFDGKWVFKVKEGATS